MSWSRHDTFEIVFLVAVLLTAASLAFWDCIGPAVIAP